VLKLGGLKTLKIPLTDFIINMDAFAEESRVYDFNFPYYEGTDSYSESVYIQLQNEDRFKEIPDDVNIEFNGTEYSLKFEKISDRELKLKRTYFANRDIIAAKDYNSFRNFAEKVTEAENTRLIFE